MSIQVSPLRQRMIDDMTIRNMTPGTQKVYIRAVKNFSLFFERSPDKLTFDDVREYHLHLASRKLEARPSTRSCARCVSSSFRSAITPGASTFRSGLLTSQIIRAKLV